MKKILILYHSNSGNTAAMAQLVGQGARQVEQTEVRIKSIDQAKDADIIWCDGLAVGCPTNLGTLSWPMKKFWDDHSRALWGKIDGKIACAFSSAASYGGGGELTCFSLVSLLMNYGFLVFGVTEFASRRFSPHYGAISAGAPEQAPEQNACLLLGAKLALWVANIYSESVADKKFTV